MPRLTADQWATIKTEYEAGTLTARALAAEFGIDHSLIGRRAAKEGWQKGNLKESQKTSKNGGLQKSPEKSPPRAPPKPKSPKVTTNVTTKTAVHTLVVDTPKAVVATPPGALLAFERVLHLLTSHRSTLREARGATLRILKMCFAKIDEWDKRIAEGGRAPTPRELSVMSGAIANLTNSLARLVPMERKAFGLTDEEGPSEVDTFTNDELDAVEAVVRKAIGMGDRA